MIAVMLTLKLLWVVKPGKVKHARGILGKLLFLFATVI